MLQAARINAPRLHSRQSLRLGSSSSSYSSLSNHIGTRTRLSVQVQQPQYYYGCVSAARQAGLVAVGGARAGTGGAAEFKRWQSTQPAGQQQAPSSPPSYAAATSQARQQQQQQQQSELSTEKEREKAESTATSETKGEQESQAREKEKKFGGTPSSAGVSEKKASSLSSSPSSSSSSGSKSVSKKTQTQTRAQKIWAKVKHEALHYWHGTKLLGKEIKISARLQMKLLRGKSLTRREKRQVSAWHTLSRVEFCLRERLSDAPSPFFLWGNTDWSSSNVRPKTYYD